MPECICKPCLLKDCWLSFRPCYFKQLSAPAASSGSPSSFSAPSAMKRSSGSSNFIAAGSAERPAHLSSAAGGAEQPAHLSSNLENKRQKCAQEEKLQTIVAYISFPNKNYNANAQRRSAMEVIHQAKQTGADVINLAFARSMDIDDLWDDIETQMESSAERPPFFYRKQGPLITLFSENCGELVGERNVDIEGGVSCLCLTFNGPAGRLIIINANWPPLPRRVRARMLDEYVSPAVEEMRSIRVIGGALAAPMFLETYIHNKGLDYQLSAKGDLCVLTKTFGRISYHCLALESSAAETLMIQLWGEPDRASVEQPDNVRLCPVTPLFDKFIENLELATENEQGREVMKFIEDNCFFGDLCWINRSGDAVQTPISLPLKMETLLEAARTQRQLYLEGLPPWRKVNVVDATHEIEEEDMRDIYNRWRWDADSWMNPETLETYNQFLDRGKKGAAQQLGKTAFSTYLFQLSGSKFLLHKLIQLPILPQCTMVQYSGSAEPPAALYLLGPVLMKCVTDLQEHKKSDTYKAAVERSKKRASDDSRLSKQIWEQTKVLSKAKALSKSAEEGHFWNLSSEEQQLVEDYDCGRLDKSLRSLVAQRAPVYRGVGASVESR